ADDVPSGTPADRNEIVVVVTDKDGGADTAAAYVTVVNAPPVIARITGPVDPLALGTAATLRADFTDAGRLDTHRCTFHWDDPAPDTEVQAAGSGDGSCSATHLYASAGVYTVGVDVTDD